MNSVARLANKFMEDISDPANNPFCNAAVPQPTPPRTPAGYPAYPQVPQSAGVPVYGSSPSLPTRATSLPVHLPSPVPVPGPSGYYGPPPSSDPSNLGYGCPPNSGYLSPPSNQPIYGPPSASLPPPGHLYHPGNPSSYGGPPGPVGPPGTVPGYGTPGPYNPYNQAPYPPNLPGQINPKHQLHQQVSPPVSPQTNIPPSYHAYPPPQAPSNQPPQPPQSHQAHYQAAYMPQSPLQPPPPHQFPPQPSPLTLSNNNTTSDLAGNAPLSNRSAPIIRSARGLSMRDDLKRNNTEVGSNATGLVDPVQGPSTGSGTGGAVGGNVEEKGTEGQGEGSEYSIKHLSITPPYTRFKYYFVPVPQEKNLSIFDLQTTHKLNKALFKNQKQVKVTVTLTIPSLSSFTTTVTKKEHIFDFDTLTYWPENDNRTVKQFRILPRAEQWYYNDADGTIKPYDINTNHQLISALLSGKSVLEKIKIGNHTYDINFGTQVQKNIATNTERKIYRELEVHNMMNWVVTFDKNPQLPAGKTALVSALSESSDEYKRIEEYFYMNVPKYQTKKQMGHFRASVATKETIHKITKIEKITNPKLREQWEFLLEKIKRDNNNNDTSIQYTRLLWHGSGTVSPNTIYEDVHYGWKINYSSLKNLWGPGLYFGEDAFYCDKYVFKTAEGKKLIFLAEVIIGDDIISLEDDTIREPWMKEDGKTRYDSVCGVRHDRSWIWIVYASGRAYPCYLIEYE